MKRNLISFKAEMITTHEELVSQQVDQEKEIFSDAIQIGVIQQPDEIADRQIPSQITSEKKFSR